MTNSINSRYILNSLDFSFVSLTQNDKQCGYFTNAQYDKCLIFSPFYKRFKMIKFSRHCEQILQKFAYAFCFQGQNAFVSLFDGINLRYKNQARQKS